MNAVGVDCFSPFFLGAVLQKNGVMFRILLAGHQRMISSVSNATRLEDRIAGGALLMEPPPIEDGVLRIEFYVR